MSNTGSFQYWQRTMVHSGPGTVVRIPGLFSNMDAKRILLISDEGIATAGLLERVSDLFAESPSRGGPQIVATFSRVAPDAEAASVDEALDVARQYAVDSILAVGGGSVQDAAKLIKIALHRKCMSVMELLRPLVRFVDWPEAQPTSIPHISVPTTAGTGAELTQAAVIYNQALGVKHLLACHYMEADIAVLDAHLTLGLPPGLTASTGMDALTHAVETVAHTHVNSFALAHAAQAVKQIVENLPIAVRDGNNVMARQRLLEASALACNAFQADLGAAPVHNFAHAVGALYHIHHGEANGVLLPAVLEKMPEFYLPTVDRLADVLGVEKAAPEETLKNCSLSIRNLLQEAGHPQTFSHHGVERAALPDVVAAVARDPIAAFCRMDKGTIEAVCRVAFGWS
jgi:alcohol dehydrogenase class IV